MSHDNSLKLSKSARNSHFIAFLPCFCLLLVHVPIDCLILFILVHFYSVTIPGDDAVDPPAKIPTLPFKPPKFDWNASNLYTQFKLFKTKVEFAFKGTYKDNLGHAKVGAVLNWLGDAAFEIYGNFMWITTADKDDPLKVLKAFEDYFRPAQNKYHCWYSLGGIYSSQFKSQSEFMVKLHECVRECSFEKPDEVVKFLFLMHNQNTRVHEELLKSMKDADGLNDILGYAHLVEGTQHSESLSKAYLDTVKILNSSVKVDAIVQKKTNTTVSFMANIMVQNIDLKVKEVAIVVTVVPATLQSIVQLMEKFVAIVIKRDTSSLFVEAVSIASLVPDGREAKVDPGRTNMKFHSMIKLMIAVGTHTSRTLSRLCTIKVFVEISLNICFDETDGQNCSRVLANLTLCKAQGPKDCHMTNFENFQGIQHRFKLDSGACGNLLPLRLYKELFPHVTRQEMLRSIDHRVQLLAYSKKEIHQYGVCC